MRSYYRDLAGHHDLDAVIEQRARAQPDFGRKLRAAMRAQDAALQTMPAGESEPLARLFVFEETLGDLAEVRVRAAFDAGVEMGLGGALVRRALPSGSPSLSQAARALGRALEQSRVWLDLEP